MDFSVISFTENGMRLSERVYKQLNESKFPDTRRIFLYTKWSGAENMEQEQLSCQPMYVDCRIGTWAKEQMEKRNILLFIGACGIAVRAIAPYVDNKLYDSPVLVMDEHGQFVIPILSGHMGGANEIALFLSEKIGAIPVITTATDLNQKFAVDLFAKKNHLAVMNKEGIAKVSSKILRGDELKISVEPYPPKEHVDMVITSENKEFDADLILKPKQYVIGMGCRRGKEAEKIETFVKEVLKEHDISIDEVFALASIDKKREEDGFLTFSSRYRLPFLTYSAEELEQAKGDFQSSSFVKEQVGVDNVCERAALKACGEDGTLIIKKHAFDGMTIAVAKKNWSVDLDEI